MYNPDTEYKTKNVDDIEDVEAAELSLTDTLLVVVEGELRVVSLSALKTFLEGI